MMPDRANTIGVYAEVVAGRGGGRSIRSHRDVVSSRWRQGRNGGLWIAPIRMQRSEA